MAFAALTRQSVRFLALFTLLGASLAGCASGSGNDSNYPEQYGGGDTYDPFGADAEEENAQGGIFGPNGLVLFGGGNEENTQNERRSNSLTGSGSGTGGGIGVNSFLWRASLDTIAFMPLTTTDPFGGVIITDWYQTPQSPEERFKLTVFILDRSLRADGVRVSVFRQERDALGGWVDAVVDPEVQVQIENSILTRARQLRVSNFSE